MNQFDFTSPGAAAVDALTQEFARQQQLKRQAMLDALVEQNTHSQIADREENRRIQAQQEADRAEEYKAHAAERQAAADKGVLAGHGPGEDVTGNDVVQQAAKRQGVGVRQIPGIAIPSASVGGGPALEPGQSPETAKPGIVGVASQPEKPAESKPAQQIYMGTAADIGKQQLAKEIEAATAAGKPMDEGKAAERAMALGIPAAEVKSYVEEMFKRAHQTFKAHVVDPISGKIVNSFPIEGTHDEVHVLPNPRANQGDDGSGGLSGLSPAAVDMAAAQIARTGNWQALRSLGIGKVSKPEKIAIMNRAAQYNLQSGQFDSANPPNLALTAGATKAATDTLNKLTQNQGAVEAFAKTAERNQKLFDEVKDQIPDFGSKFLNAPIRSLAANFGSKEMQQFQIAWQSLTTEYSKIINNPNLTGVLSDNARHEMEQAMSPNATVGMMETAMKTLSREANSRRASFAEQIAETRDLLGSATVGEKKLSIEDIKAKHHLKY